MTNVIQLSRLRAADVPSPLTADAREVTVVRRDGEGFLVAKGHDSKGRRRSGYYYTIRNATHWRGYKIADNITAVRRIIKEA